MAATAAINLEETPCPKKNSDELRKAMEAPLQAFWRSQEGCFHPSLYETIDTSWAVPAMATAQGRRRVNWQFVATNATWLLAEGSLHP